MDGHPYKSAAEQWADMAHSLVAERERMRRLYPTPPPRGQIAAKRPFGNASYRFLGPVDIEAEHEEEKEEGKEEKKEDKKIKQPRSRKRNPLRKYRSRKEGKDLAKSQQAIIQFRDHTGKFARKKLGARQTDVSLKAEAKNEEDEDVTLPRMQETEQT